ncbi:MAG: CoA transferase [Pseudomonadota bacterium]
MSEPFQPLQGIRVVELSHMVMGPSCGMFLAFLGADVVKVEPPGGDKTRQLTGMGAGFFPMFNRGKKSVCLDLQSDEGKADLDKLLKAADVFVENFKDGSLVKMGLDPDTLRQRYPDLIIASNKGFLHGPYEHRTAMDEVVQMMTGLAYMTGPSGRPLRIGSSANDIMAGLFGALSVMGAVLEREKGGAGRSIRIGLFENCLLLVGQHMVQHEIEGTESPPMPERSFSWPVYDIFETADGRQLFIGAITSGHWASLCDILNLTELRDDPSLESAMDRISARSRTLPLFTDAVARQDASTLAAALTASDIPFAPVQRPVEMYDDPHVNRPGGLVTTRQSDGSSYRAPGLPLEVDGMPVAVENTLSAAGADTEDVMSALEQTTPRKAD